MIPLCLEFVMREAQFVAIVADIDQRFLVEPSD